MKKNVLFGRRTTTPASSPYQAPPTPPAPQQSAETLANKLAVREQALSAKVLQYDSAFSTSRSHFRRTRRSPAFTDKRM